MVRPRGKYRPLPEKPLITWTRFYLPRDQEWPVWTVDHDDIHAGPLTRLPCLRLGLARMVDKPDQAAYIIEWYTQQDFKNFESSPACVEFLRNLPESAASEESSSRLEHLNLDDESAPLPKSSGKSRFRVYKHSTRLPTRELEGLVTLTAFSVPAKIDDNDSRFLEISRALEAKFSAFRPQGYTWLTKHGASNRFICIWLWVLEEDSWVEEKFGTLKQSQPGEDDPSRAILCHIFLWSRGYAEPHKEEEASAADPQARESWERRAALVMPPATAWVQERWDIRQVPRFEASSSEEEGEGPEWEEELEDRRRLEEFRAQTERRKTSNDAKPQCSYSAAMQVCRRG
ncbi:hypothetical protein CRV24_004617 [Beauveria bassiana]|uniref:ABM domain-containing protein n=1 Tax=Beauveria bassiana (strain ARSEF 2860) TaxID=655819 RepID=J4W1H6_BEAB2|nr:uncharacterized protein BBA_06712 [Beauveria bassiana ARSEF 2860]EJP64330.1 hypothetical protein BBA_06712 [Beauveria bassiana ARSEF 2860]KAF1735691.1 hypothetical protein CRV24_004617 [Beauveria bassiana]KAH8711253.1 hypothetical protein HC256_008067 [Beauveria bassiana]